jgi:hypothetical protein
LTDEETLELAQDGAFDEGQAEVINDHTGPECLFQLSAGGSNLNEYGETEIHTFIAAICSVRLKLSKCLPRPCWFSGNALVRDQGSVESMLTSLNKRRKSDGRGKSEQYQDVVSAASPQHPKARDAPTEHKSGGDAIESNRDIERLTSSNIDLHRS